MKMLRIIRWFRRIFRRDRPDHKGKFLPHTSF
jgi:hypothetical protein